MGLVVITYFDGHLTDGEKMVRLVSFDSKVLQKLTDFQEHKEPITILNCKVEEGKWSSEHEIHTKKLLTFSSLQLNLMAVPL